MARTTNPSHRSRRPAPDGRREPRRTAAVTGRPAPAQTGTAAVTGRDRRGRLTAGPVSIDPPTAEHLAVTVIDLDGTHRPTRGRWVRDTSGYRADPKRPANVYGTKRTATVGATGRAAAERERQSAVAASRRDALRIRARIRRRDG